MKLFNYYIVRRRNMYRSNKFYIFPKKLTLLLNPPIYTWGYWNFSKINIQLDSW